MARREKPDDQTETLKELRWQVVRLAMRLDEIEAQQRLERALATCRDGE
jgi:hypothetical protein